MNCSDDPTQARFSSDVLDPDPSNAEGEVIGRLYDNGVPTTRLGLVVVLTPLSDTNRLKGETNLSFHVNPASDLDFEWFDPASSDGLTRCGTLTEYNKGNMLARSAEVHGASETGREEHCIRPGIYILSVLQNGQLIPGARFEVEYQQIEPAVTVYEGQVQHSLASRLYDEAGGSGSIVDLFVNIELGQSNGTDRNTVLKIDKPGSDPRISTFAPVPNPSGTPDDFFRFSLNGSDVSWKESSPGARGRMLARFFWDTNDPLSSQTAYREVFSGLPILQPFKYGPLATNKSSVSVGVDLKAPDQFPKDQPEHQRPIAMSGNGPGACISYAPTRVWIGTDFQVNGSFNCVMMGDPGRWSWAIQFTVTPWSPSSYYVFPGFTSAGTQQVVLFAKDSTTGRISSDTVSITVLPYQVAIQGPTLVKDKLKKYYVGNINGQWYERFLSQTEFYPATSGMANDSFPRIWPATSTHYYVELLEESRDSATLKRGKLMVHVCGSTYSGCMIEPNVASSPATPTSSEGGSVNPWSIFGGGPILSWGSSTNPRVARLYDLRGNHSPGSAFTVATGLLESSGEDRARLANGSLRWYQKQVPNAKLVRFIVDPPESGTVFGISLDPDHGEYAWDERTGYDAERGLLYVFDRSGVTGVALRTVGSNALASIRQYGATRFAPGTDAALWDAQRKIGTDILQGEDDVQLIVSAPPISGTTEYELLLITAGSIDELRGRYDAVAKLQSWQIVGDHQR